MSLSPQRQRRVESVWHHRAGSWVASFDVKLNDVMVGTFYDADDYDDIRAHLVAMFGPIAPSRCVGCFSRTDEHACGCPTGQNGPPNYS